MKRRSSKSSKNKSMIKKSELRFVMRIVSIMLILVIWLMGAIGKENDKNKRDPAYPINYSSDNFNLGNVTNYAIEKDIIDAKATREKYIPIFNRVYGNGYYKKDFNETERFLNELVEKRLEDELSESLEIKVIVKSNFVYFKDSMEAFENGQLTYQEIRADLSSYVYKGQIEIYFFTEQWLDEDFHKKAFYCMNKNKDMYDLMNRNDIVDLVFAFSEEVLVKYNENRIRNSAYAFAELIKLEPEYAEGDYCHINYNKKTPSYESVINLTNSYNQKFGFVHYGEYDYFLLDEPEIHFRYKNMYLAVLAQKYMGELAYSVIDELGASDKIVQFTRIDDESSGLSRMAKVEYKEVVSPYKFLDEVYNDASQHNSDDFEVLFIYMLRKGEKIDYELALNILKKMYKSMPTDNNDELIYVLYMEFYVIDDASKSVVVDLFRNNLMPMRDHEKDYSLATGLGKMFDIDYDTEGFRVLDAYGVKLNSWTNACADLSDRSVTDFENKIIRKIDENRGEYLWN